jgi:ribosomal protein S18 acetylase RimI-like enzyme
MRNVRMAKPVDSSTPAAEAGQLAIADYTEADVRALTDIHMAAFRGYMNAGIGPSYVRALLRWFLDRPGAIALKAQRGGLPCGYVAGMAIAEHADLNRDLLVVSAVGVASHPWVMLQKRYRKSAWAKIKRAFKRRRPAEVPKSAAVEGRGAGLFSIAADPRCSGRGVGAALMKAFEQRAAELGYHYLQLSVYADNARARAVYDKAGWELCDSGGEVVTYRKRLA